LKWNIAEMDSVSILNFISKIRNDDWMEPMLLELDYCCYLWWERGWTEKWNAANIKDSRNLIIDENLKIFEVDFEHINEYLELKMGDINQFIGKWI